MADNYVQLTYGYVGTDFTRQFTISKIADSIAADESTIKAKILAINASLQAGTATDLANFFRSDDYDGTNGKLNRIAKARLVTETVTNIPKTTMSIRSTLDVKMEDNPELETDREQPDEQEQREEQPDQEQEQREEQPDQEQKEVKADENVTVNRND